MNLKWKKLEIKREVYIKFINILKIYNLLRGKIDCSEALDFLMATNVPKFVIFSNTLVDT